MPPGCQRTIKRFQQRGQPVIWVDAKKKELVEPFKNGDREWRSVKHEEVYPKCYVSMAELAIGLAQYFAFYNGELPHQPLVYKTPGEV